MKNAVFWAGMPSGACANQRFGGTWRLPLHGVKIQCTRNNVSVTRSVRRFASYCLSCF
jgi:hypothetical protein